MIRENIEKEYIYDFSYDFSCCRSLFLVGSLLVVLTLSANHQIRYRNGYYDELDGDYQTLMEQQRK